MIIFVDIIFVDMIWVVLDNILLKDILCLRVRINGLISCDFSILSLRYEFIKITLLTGSRYLCLNG